MKIQLTEEQQEFLIRLGLDTLMKQTTEKKKQKWTESQHKKFSETMRKKWQEHKKDTK